MTHPPLILVCDHRGEGLSEAIRPLGTVGFRLHTSTSLGQTREQLPDLAPDLIVVDPLARGGVVELEVIDQLRSETALPVLLVAEPTDPLPAVMAARALENGPWDLVYRAAPVEEILMRVERLRSEVDHRVELEEMRYQAAHDDRTELLRPLPFQERLREHFSAAQRHHLDLAFLLIDLDQFGRVNKDFDHVLGDQIITRVGTVIRDSLRAEDVGGRLGGDEFAVLLPYTKKVDAARVVNRMRDQIQDLTGPVDGAPRELHMSASLGFETFDGADLDSVETLRRHAEVALRRAKMMGGNRGLYYRSLEPEGTQEEGAGEDAPHPAPAPSGSPHEDRT